MDTKLRVPRMIFQSEIRKYFSYNNVGELFRIWATTKQAIVCADNGKEYVARYDHDRWGNGVIRLKRKK